MLYYSDEEQTTLKGILYLDRCKCIIENNNTFVIFSANTSHEDWINPLNKKKLKYTWCVPSNSRGKARDILRMWHESTTAAIKASKALRKLMYIQECFLNAPNLLEYCALMESFRNQKGKSKWHFKIPLAWLRYHKHDAEMALEDELRIRVANSDDNDLKSKAVRKTSSTNWDSNRLSVATRRNVELQDLQSHLGQIKDKRKLRYSTTCMRQVRKDMPRDSMQINGVRSVLETNKQIHKYNTLEYTGTFHGYQWRSSNTSCVSSYREAHLDDKEIFGFVLSMSGYRRSSSGSTISSTCGFGFQSYVLFVFTQIQQTCKIQHSNKYRYDKWW